MWTVFLADALETLALGRALGASLSGPARLALSGDLGAGKTTFTQGLAEGLGIYVPVVSPTFVIMSEYDSGRVPLLHGDAYRLNAGEALSIGMDEAIDTWPGVVVIEWAEKVEDFFDGPHIRLHLSHEERGRRAHLQATGRCHVELLEKWQGAYLG